MLIIIYYDNYYYLLILNKIDQSEEKFLRQNGALYNVKQVISPKQSYVCNQQESQDINQTKTDRAESKNRQINNIVGNFKIPLSSIDRITGLIIIKEIGELCHIY